MRKQPRKYKYVVILHPSYKYLVHAYSRLIRKEFAGLQSACSWADFVNRTIYRNRIYRPWISIQILKVSNSTVETILTFNTSVNKQTIF